MRAFAGLWVFPGGQVDPEDGSDHWRQWISDYDTVSPGRVVAQCENREYGIHMRQYWDEAFESVRQRYPDAPRRVNWVPRGDLAVQQSVWITAIRELYEETGILVGIPSGTISLDHHRQPSRARVQDICEQYGIRLDLSMLRYAGRLVPPPLVPVRFDTRFFVAWLPRGQTIESNMDEVAGETWLDPRTYLDGAGSYPMALPTQYVMGYLSQFSSALEFWQAIRAGSIEKPERGS